MPPTVWARHHQERYSNASTTFFIRIFPPTCLSPAWLPSWIEGLVGCTTPMPNTSCEQKEIALKPGESILLYSDGLVEAHDPHREMFGFPRMQGLVGAHPGGASLIDFLLAELAHFTGEEWEQEDDIALLTLQRLRS